MFGRAFLQQVYSKSLLIHKIQISSFKGIEERVVIIYLCGIIGKKAKLLLSINY